MGKIIEGYWDCPQCGTQKIKGRFRYCKSCGRPRGKNVKFYMIEKDNYVDNPEKISKEPDWYCSFCQSLNPAAATTCESCGASQEDSDKNYFDLLEEAENEKKEKERLEREIENKTTEIEDEMEDDVRSEYDFKNAKRNPYHNSNHNDNFPFNFQKIFAGLAAALTAILLVCGLVWLFTPKETVLKIQDKAWERSIEIEEYKTVRESDWHIPSGGRLAYTKSEIHHYDQVLDHYETVTEQKSERYISGYETVVTGHRDLGNGYFEEITSQQPIYDTRYWTETHEEPVYVSVPRYRDKYYYDIERWVHKTWKKSSGTTDDPYWPELDLKAETERSGAKKASY